MMKRNGGKLYVEVFSVIATTPVTEFIYGKESFVVQHESFERASYLLKPNIYLAFISEDLVYFVESDPADNLFDTRKYPFFFEAFKIKARRLVTMKVDNFMELSIDIGAPRCEVIWIFHTGRCSSTALAQALHVVDGVTVISEPVPLIQYIHDKCFHFGCSVKELLENEGDQLNSMGVACINFILKDFSAEKKVCWKTTACCEYQVLMPMVTKNYPVHKVISVHRDGKGVVTSFYKVYSALVPIWILLVYIKIAGYLPRYLQKKASLRSFAFSSGMVLEEKELLEKEQDAFLYLYAQWISNMAYFRRNARRLKHLFTIYHDDFQDNKRESVTKVKVKSLVHGNPYITFNLHIDSDL